MTPQEQIAATLKRSGIPSRQIQCYGSQIMITTIGRDSADRWYRLLKQICSTVRGPGQGYDDKAGTGPNDNRRETYIRVWRVWGTV